MSNSALDNLKQTFGPAAAQLPDLDDVPEAVLVNFNSALNKAREDQKRLLDASADHSLRLVPRLLRPVVRKVLFG